MKRTALLATAIALSSAPALAAQGVAFDSVVQVAATDTKAPQLKKIGSWYYPAGRLHDRATVVLQAEIDEKGEVEPASAKVVRSTDPGFNAGAIATLLTAHFKPAMEQKHPEPVTLIIPLVFDGRHKPRCELSTATADPPPLCGKQKK